MCDSKENACGKCKENDGCGSSGKSSCLKHPDVPKDAVSIMSNINIIPPQKKR